MTKFVDICVQIPTGAAGRGQAIAAINILGLRDELLAVDENGDDVIIDQSAHAIIDIWEQPILAFGEYDPVTGDEITPPVFAPSPYLRIRFASDRAKTKWGAVDRGALPPGFKLVADPGTRKWAGDP